MVESPEDPKTIVELKFTVEELAAQHKVHRSTIQKLFVDEPGVIRFGHGGSRKKRQYFTLRIPVSVAVRVFNRMTVSRGDQ
jgi:hypothetical protein